MTAPTLAFRSAPAPRSHDLLDRAVGCVDADPSADAGRAYDGLRLRMGAEAELVPIAFEEPGSLAHTLDEIGRRGATLVASSRGLRLIHAHRLPALSDAVAAHEAALGVWLALRDAPVPSGFAADEWDAATRLHARWFALAFEMPALPLALRPGERIRDAAAFRRGVAARLSAGPAAPGADRLREDLSQLFERYAVADADGSAASPTRRRAA